MNKTKEQIKSTDQRKKYIVAAFKELSKGQRVTLVRRERDFFHARCFKTKGRGVYEPLGDFKILLTDVFTSRHDYDLAGAASRIHNEKTVADSVVGSPGYEKQKKANLAIVSNPEDLEKHYAEVEKKRAASLALEVDKRRPLKTGPEAHARHDARVAAEAAEYAAAEKKSFGVQGGRVSLAAEKKKQKDQGVQGLPLAEAAQAELKKQKGQEFAAKMKAAKLKKAKERAAAIAALPPASKEVHAQVDQMIGMDKPPARRVTASKKKVEPTPGRKWEDVVGDTQRLAVPGGWIYLVGEQQAVFVPESS